MKVRKKPVEVEAVLYDGKLVGEPNTVAPGDEFTAHNVIPDTCPDWFPALSREVASVADAYTLEAGQAYAMKGDVAGALYIITLEGHMRANPGDWIIRGVNGEIYPCAPDIFAKTYDVVGVVE